VAEQNPNPNFPRICHFWGLWDFSYLESGFWLEDL
jgi:hypothetical protein